VPLPSYKPHFSRFLERNPDRLHFAAHSHHLWPDVTREAHVRAWDDASQLVDAKWGVVFGEVVEEGRRHVARLLNLPDPSTVCFGPSVHAFLVRLASAIETDGPLRVLSTGSEFHSFTRQMRRWVEAGRAEWTQVPAEPFETLPERFEAAAAEGGFDLIYASHVLYDSGHVFADVFRLLAEAPGERTLRMVDAYHGFMALPTDLGPYADRLFYSSGGYKYAMAGEGCCFLHAPPGQGPRPVDTGWFAGFSALPYPEDGSRFMGATFDPTGVYRLNAVQRWLADEGVTVEAIHERVRALQERFLTAVGEGGVGDLSLEQLVPGVGAPDRGNFLTFRRPDAGDLHRRYAERGVVTDFRDDRLRLGFGLYHDESDVDSLVTRLRG